MADFKDASELVFPSTGGALPPPAADADPADPADSVATQRGAGASSGSETSATLSQSDGRVPTADDDDDDYELFSKSTTGEFVPDITATGLFEAFAASWLRQRRREQAETEAAMKRSSSLESLLRGKAADIRRKGQTLRHRLSSELEARTRAMEAKTRALEARMAKAPFVRAVDKLSFVVGVCQLPLTLYGVLCQPQWFSVCWTLVIVPMLVYRYFTYHALKFHYFLLDFCYYSQLLALYFLYVRPSEPLFQMLFLICNGPLASAIVMWKNSLVFHDWDKTISVFVHYHPALLTYVLRWWKDGPNAGRPNGFLATSAPGVHTLCGTMLLYTFWQVVYLIKTEVVDKRKLDSDKDIMTSMRWLSERRPHPLYRWLRARGFTASPLTMIVIVQFFYTLVVMTPMLLAFHYRRVHEAYLILIFVACTYNGANHYFNAFAEQYTARLEKPKRAKPSTYSTKLWSLTVFAFFAALTLFSLFVIVEMAIYIATL